MYISFKIFDNCHLTLLLFVCSSALKKNIRNDQQTDIRNDKQTENDAMITKGHLDTLIPVAGTPSMVQEKLGTGSPPSTVHLT